MDLIKQINWLHTIILVGTPSLALYGALTVPLQHNTFVWAYIYYVLTGLGITAGYHRLFAHRAYEATLPLKLWLLAFGTGAVEGSVRWWCRDHRAHHRYTDTDKDPYSAPKGFFYSHIGWMLLKQDPNKIGHASITDLNADPYIRWQHRNYLFAAIVMGFAFPMMVAGFGWGDWAGGFFFAGCARLVLVHHATFLVNSLAHTLGDLTYADDKTPKDSVITALLTFGEGYHNFHHEFPYDYRNAVQAHQYDPTKWFILGCAYLGLAFNLKKFPENEVKKGKYQMMEKQLATIKKELDWGKNPDDLPVWHKHDMDMAAATGKQYIVISGLVHDVTAFIKDHPGGKEIMAPYLGKDATEAFHGGVYKHSNGAKNLLTSLRVARLSVTNPNKHD